MLARTKPPFRADHVGSLIRPDALIKAREAAERGEIAPAELADIQHDAIRDVVRLQEELGLRLATDGEYNRTFWQRDFLLKFRNVEQVASKLTVRFHSAAGARDHSPPSLQRDRQACAAERHFCRRFQVPQIGRARHGENHHSVADHDAFSRRP